MRITCDYLASQFLLSHSPSDGLEPHGVGVVGAVDHDLVRLVGRDVPRRDVHHGRVCNQEGGESIDVVKPRGERGGGGLIDEEIPSTLSQCVGRMTMTALSVPPLLSTGSIARWRAHCRCRCMQLQPFRQMRLVNHVPKITMPKVDEPLSIRRNEESVPKVLLI